MKVTVPLYTPAARLLAPLLSDAVTMTVPPAASVPPLEERLSHGWLADAVQLSAAVPLLVSVKLCKAGVNGPPTGPAAVKAALGVTPRLSGISNASVTPLVVELAGTTALAPMPRLANAAHSSFLFAPALSTRSACTIASRAWRNVGFAGDSFMPSVTSRIAIWLPAAPPSLLIRFARTSQSATHHTSPWPWTSEGFEFEDEKSGLSGMPVCALASEGSMSFSVSGFFVMSVVYGYRRMP